MNLLGFGLLAILIFVGDQGLSAASRTVTILPISLSSRIDPPKEGMKVDIVLPKVEIHHSKEITGDITGRITQVYDGMQKELKRLSQGKSMSSFSNAKDINIFMRKVEAALTQYLNKEYDPERFQVKVPDLLLE